jgi:hypothetical protein
VRGHRTPRAGARRWRSRRRGSPLHPRAANPPHPPKAPGDVRQPLECGDSSPLSPAPARGKSGAEAPHSERLPPVSGAGAAEDGPAFGLRRPGAALTLPLGGTRYASPRVRPNSERGPRRGHTRQEGRKKDLTPFSDPVLPVEFISVPAARLLHPHGVAGRMWAWAGPSGNPHTPVQRRNRAASQAPRVRHQPTPKTAGPPRREVVIRRSNRCCPNQPGLLGQPA